MQAEKFVGLYDYSLTPTSQFYFCGLPFRLDVAPKCRVGCRYCFSMYNIGQHHANISIADPKRLERKLTAVFLEKNIQPDINAEFIKNRQPVHFGGLADPFMSTESMKITLEMLKALSDHDYPVVLSTKNATYIIRDDVLRVLQKLKYLIIQLSMATPENKYSKIVEPYAPSVSDRLKALSTLSQLGFYCTVRLQPLFIPWIKPITTTLIPSIAHSGCRHVIIEFLKIPYVLRRNQFIELFKEIDWNGFDVYSKLGAYTIGRELILPAAVKWEILQPIIHEIRTNNMTYGSGDYGLNHLGDTDCCCGIDQIDGFENWFQSNFSFTIRNANSEYLKFSDLRLSGVPKRSIKRYIDSDSRLEGPNTLTHLLKNKWNSPGTPNAPDCHLGVKSTNEIDESGNMVYSVEKILIS